MLFIPRQFVKVHAKRFLIAVAQQWYNAADKVISMLASLFMVILASVTLHHITDI